MNRRVSWAVLALLGAALVASVEAHMALKKAEPADKSTITAPPAAVTLWFTQKPDITVSRLTLVGPSGEVRMGRLQTGNEMQLTAPVEGTLTNGAYRIDWQAAGDDGHIQKGSVAFTLNRAQ